MIFEATTRSEIEALVPLVAEFGAQSNVHAEFEEESWVDRWSKFIESDRAVVFYQMNGTVDPVGMLGAFLYESHLDGIKQSKEAFWFVDPKHRGAGTELLDAYEEWAIENGAKRVWMVRLDGWREKAMDRLYQRRGYEPVERAFCKEID